MRKNLTNNFSKQNYQILNKNISNLIFLFCKNMGYFVLLGGDAKW